MPSPARRSRWAVVSEPVRADTTLRAPSSLISFWCAAALAAFLVGDAAVRGRWDVVGRWAPTIALIVWLLWLALYRSSVTLAADRLVVTNLARVHDIAAVRVVDAMTRTPRTVRGDALAIDCIEIMEAPPKVTLLLVVDADQHLVGAIHLHDLFKARIV